MELITDFGSEYDSLRRYISYHKQMELTTKYTSKNDFVLEIGVGNKTLNTILKNKFLDVTSVDILSELNPNYVMDVRDLRFKKNCFDILLAFEVLEHIPYSSFLIALSELKRVSRKYVIISLPYWNASFELIIKFPGLGLFRQPPILRPHIEIPYFWRKLRSKEHYWEIGAKGYPMKRIKKDLSDIGKIKEIVKIPINNHHIFFVIEVKK